MNKKELISIIVPVYQTEQFIERCIESILKQTYTCFELILIDDGSTDSSYEICKSYKAKDSRIILKKIKNGGIGKARNEGIKIARGCYYAFVDSDDFIESDYIQNLYYSLIDNDSDFSICGVNKVWPEINKTETIAFLKNETIFRSTTFFNKWAHGDGFYYGVTWGKLFKKDCFKKLRFQENRIHEDEFLSNQIYDNDYLVSVVNKPLYNYVQHKSSTIHNRNNQSYIDAVEMLIERYHKCKKYQYINECSIAKEGMYNCYLSLKYISIRNDGLKKKSIILGLKILVLFPLLKKPKKYIKLLLLTIICLFK